MCRSACCSAIDHRQCASLHHFQCQVYLSIAPTRYQAHLFSCSTCRHSHNMLVCFFVASFFNLNEQTLSSCFCQNQAERISITQQLRYRNHSSIFVSRLYDCAIKQCAARCGPPHLKHCNGAVDLGNLGLLGLILCCSPLV